MADSRCFSNVIDGRFNANFSIRGYIKLPNPVRETRRGYKWTLKADLNEGVMLGLVTKANALGIELADGRHCSLQGKILKRLWKISLTPRTYISVKKCSIIFNTKGPLYMV